MTFYFFSVNNMTLATINIRSDLGETLENNLKNILTPAADGLDPSWLQLEKDSRSRQGHCQQSSIEKQTKRQ